MLRECWSGREARGGGAPTVSGASGEGEAHGGRAGAPGARPLAALYHRVAHVHVGVPVVDATCRACGEALGAGLCRGLDIDPLPLLHLPTIVTKAGCSMDRRWMRNGCSCRCGRGRAWLVSWRLLRWGALQRGCPARNVGAPVQTDAGVAGSGTADGRGVVPQPQRALELAAGDDLVAGEVVRVGRPAPHAHLGASPAGGVVLFARLPCCHPPPTPHRPPCGALSSLTRPHRDRPSCSDCARCFSQPSHPRMPASRGGGGGGRAHGCQPACPPAPAAQAARRPPFGQRLRPAASWAAGRVGGGGGGACVLAEGAQDIG